MLSFSGVSGFVIFCIFIIESVSATERNYCNLDANHLLCQLKPDSYGECIPQTSIYPETFEKSFVITEEDKHAIVDRYNVLRRNLAKGLELRGDPGPQPPASNMREVVWDDELALMAQTWMNQCNYTYGRGVYGTSLPDRHQIEENIYWDYFKVGKPLNYTPFIDFWYDHVEGYPNKSNSFRFGNIARAEMSRVGCGVVIYYDHEDPPLKGTVHFSCFYSSESAGDPLYKQGPAGSDCPAGTSDVDGLCHADKA